MGRRDGILLSGVPESRLWSCYLRCRWLSSDQHDPGIARPGAEHRLRGVLPQGTRAALTRLAAQCRDVAVGNFADRLKTDTADHGKSIPTAGTTTLQPSRTRSRK